jgi:ribosomal protein S18 acetylase RimI-like enzyme
MRLYQFVTHGCAEYREEDEQEKVQHGHITSVAVLRSHRKLGLATKLMEQSLHSMVRSYLSYLFLTEYPLRSLQEAADSR